MSNPIVVPEGREVVQEREPDPLVVRNAPDVSVPGHVYVLPPSPVVPPTTKFPLIFRCPGPTAAFVFPRAREPETVA